MQSFGRSKDYFNTSLLSPYWWCQLLGWGIVIPYWMHFEQAIDGSYTIPLLILVFQAGIFIFITHQYRNLAHRFGWVDWSGRKLVLVIVPAYLVLVIFYLIVTFVIVGLRYGNVFDWATVIGAFAGGARYNAIWLLCFHGYHLARKSAQVEMLIAKEQQLATAAKLAKLQAELNPHFLFNALNSIKALTRENPANARKAIDGLAGLLRYSFRQNKYFLVPLAEEIEMVKSYIALEKIRLEERLSVQWEIPLTIEDCVLPPLSLHTLVENGVKHGIARASEGGVISIVLESKTDYWCFTVCSSGDYQPVEGVGTGLRNLEQRLELQFQEKGLILIENGDQKGEVFTRARLKIPKK